MTLSPGRPPSSRSCSSRFPALFAFVHVPGGPIPVLLLLRLAVAWYFRRTRDADRAARWR